MKRKDMDIPSIVGHPQGDRRLPMANGFIEFLIENQCSRYSIIHGVLGANRLFRPPLHVEDLVTLALTQMSNRVLPKSGTGYLTPESLDIGTWFPEVDRIGCLSQVTIVRIEDQFESRHFEVSPKPCHQLNCPSCRPQRNSYLAQEVIHSSSKGNFWLSEIEEGHWSATLRYLAENCLTYIIFPYTSQMLSYEEIKSARCIPNDAAKLLLEGLFSANDHIVTNDYMCEDNDFPFPREIRWGDSWLPAHRLTEIAVSLGAESSEIGQWYIPETINILTWRETFNQAVCSSQDRINHAVETLTLREKNRVLDELFMLGQYPRLFTSTN